jgi:hypothetical protein
MKTEVSHACFTLAFLLAFSCCGQVYNLNDNGPGSLRDVVGVTVSGTVTFQPGLHGTITLTNGEIPIGQSIRIQGPGADKLTVDGNATDRVFEIGNGATVTISGLCISNGAATDVAPSSGYVGGGGVLNNQGCTLTLSNCWVVNCFAFGAGASMYGSAYGGGIYSEGALAVIGTTVSGNQAWGGDATDAWEGLGGGIGVGYEASTLTLSNCTITGNTAGGGTGDTGGLAYGGGLFSAPLFLCALNHCTITGNRALGGTGVSVVPSGSGGGINAARPIMIDTIVAANTVGPSGGPQDGFDCFGVVKSQGFNLIGNADGSSGWITSEPGKDLTGATGFELKPALGPLQFRGGTTPTMIPLPDSAAVDNGTAAGLTTDQRGKPRPQVAISHSSFPPGGDGSDIGAVEVFPPLLYIAPRETVSSPTLALLWTPNPEFGWDYNLVLKSAPHSSAGNWETSSLPYSTINGTNFAVINSPTGSMFFRLKLILP